MVLGQLRQNVVRSGSHSSEHRLSRWLLEAADRLETDPAPIPVTQEDLARRLGLRRTTVTLLAAKLQEVGAIRWGRSRVEILDRTRLEPIACTCYATLREDMKKVLASTLHSPTPS
jgi:CRP-like cAMP-binding protein